MIWIAYRGTDREKKVIVPDKKRFNGKTYELADVYSNYGQFRGRKDALASARTIRDRGSLAKVESHDGYIAVYMRRGEKQKPWRE